MMKKVVFPLFLCIAATAALWGAVRVDACADTFKIATYNVENLFDLAQDPTDYPDYRPNGGTGWTAAMLARKLDNIAAVIKDLDAEIVALQEIESKDALTLLQEALAREGAHYEFAIIADQVSASVKCALLSRFPVLEKKEIAISRKNARHILKAVLEIAGKELILYVNHWKSKSGPESRRMEYAESLAREISRLPCDTDYILIGDFNADYNEYETFRDVPRLNDTGGVTGINHVIRTLRDGRPVDESVLNGQAGCAFLYNLWLEIPEKRRWSVNFFGRKNSPDGIIVPKALYDASGISYVDNSFDKFDPDYLFDDNRLFRWQRANRGAGRHLGQGYSDHLPVFAKFTTAPFRAAEKTAVLPRGAEATASIGDLYDDKTDLLPARIENAAVIFKNGGNAVIKQKNGRAVYVYKAARKLVMGMAYDLTVTNLKGYYGNLELVGIEAVKGRGSVPELAEYYLSGEDIDFSAPEFQNEVIRRVTGIYENKWFHYGNDRKIRTYFLDAALAPENFSRITLSQVRIGYHGHPEIIVEKPEQMAVR